jgi:hypothetical protein
MRWLATLCLFWSGLGIKMNKSVRVTMALSAVATAAALASAALAETSVKSISYGNESGDQAWVWNGGSYGGYGDGYDDRDRDDDHDHDKPPYKPPYEKPSRC